MLTRTLAHLLLVVGLAGSLLLAVEPSVFSIDPALTAAIELRTISTDNASAPDKLTISSISLTEQVVPAQLIDEGGRATWEIPAFAVGHAQGTPGAGALGNVVLIGHVESRQAGNVFKDLHRVREKDVVALWSGDRRFPYRVTLVSAVSRDDASVLRSSDQATITLITCSGRWIPFLRDYSERLVVQGTLIDETATSPLTY